MNDAVPAEVDHAAGGPARLQVAADGCWERAGSAGLPATPEDIDALLAACGSVDISLEVLWSGPPIVFVGARSGLAQRQRGYRIAARGDWTPSQALEVLAGGGLGPATRAALGTINAWRSTGPLPLDLDFDPMELHQVIASRIDLLEGEHPLGLEIAHDQPCEAWWAVEVSSRKLPVDERHVDQVVAAVQRLLDLSRDVVNG